MPDYEILLDLGSSGIVVKRQGEFMGAEFGGGRAAVALVGDADTILYTTTYRRTPRNGRQIIQARTYNNVTIGTPVSRWWYIQQFVQRRKANLNDPFWVVERIGTSDGGSNRLIVLCRLTLKSLNGFQMTQDQRNNMLDSYTLEFTQARGEAAQS